MLLLLLLFFTLIQSKYQQLSFIKAKTKNKISYPKLRTYSIHIPNIDSVVSIRPALNNPAYTASKAGLVQLTKGLAMKWGRKGIRVNGIAPGMVPTKLTANQAGETQEAAFKKRNPIPRFGTPQDIAGGALFLASPLASYITGQQLIIDGGLTL